MEEALIELLRVCQSNGDTKIFLNYTNLTEIPAEVLQLKYLKELYLKRNLLSSLVRLGQNKSCLVRETPPERVAKREGGYLGAQIWPR